MRYRVLASAVALMAALFPAPSGAVAPPGNAAAERPSNAAVAARIAGRLGCESFEYVPGANSASSSQGQLNCHLERQDYVVYVFPSNRYRARGVSHLKLWNDPGDVYYFVQAHRAIIAPQGSRYPGPAYSKKWAKAAADRTCGAVFHS